MHLSVTLSERTVGQILVADSSFVPFSYVSAVSYKGLHKPVSMENSWDYLSSESHYVSIAAEVK